MSKSVKVNFQDPQLQSNTESSKYCLRTKQLKPQLVRNYAKRNKFFTNRVVKLWNSLPQNAVDTKNLNNFKHELSLLRHL